MRDDLHDLVKRAKDVLDGNWLGASTKPAPALYPHQWNWDSEFIAVGYARYHQTRAQQELSTLFKAQSLQRKQKRSALDCHRATTTTPSLTFTSIPTLPPIFPRAGFPTSTERAWHTEGWVGAVLPASRFSALESDDEQKEVVKTHLLSGFSAAFKILRVN